MTDKGRNEMSNLHLLAPWYANGTLDEESRKAFEKALKSDASLRRALEAARAEQEAAVALAVAESMPSAAVLDRILSEVQATARARVSQSRQSLAAQFKNFLTSLSPASLATAGIAAALLIAVQFSAIGVLVSGGGSMELASGETEEPGAAADAQLFLVKFMPGASVGEITALLERLDLRLVDGPAGGGLYTVAADKERKNVLTLLQAESTMVAFAAASGPSGGE